MNERRIVNFRKEPIRMFKPLLGERMRTPQLKERNDLSATDFEEHPVWIAVRYGDVDEPWYESSDEQTYRPWTGALPFAAKGKCLVSATFRLADGTAYPGYFEPQPQDWDAPPPPRKMRDGNFTEPFQWSARRGGSPLSILALHCPIIFVDGRVLGFHLLRDPERRKNNIREFFAALDRQPREVFPVRFYSPPGHFSGITSGVIDGFYSFGLDRQPEIDTGEGLLMEGTAPDPDGWPKPD